MCALNDRVHVRTHPRSIALPVDVCTRELLSATGTCTKEFSITSAHILLEMLPRCKPAAVKTRSGRTKNATLIREVTLWLELFELRTYKGVQMCHKSAIGKS